MPDLVLCGDLAADRATGSFPAFPAVSPGAAQALGCVRLEPLDGRALRVHRRLDGGPAGGARAGQAPLTRPSTCRSAGSSRG